MTHAINFAQPRQSLGTREAAESTPLWSRAQLFPIFCGMRLSPESMYANRQADVYTIVRLGVAVIVHGEAGKILLERRSDCGWWGLPEEIVPPARRLLADSIQGLSGVLR